MEEIWNTYNTIEIKSNITKAIELALNDHPQEHWDAIKSVETRLLEMFDLLDE